MGQLRHRSPNHMWPPPLLSTHQNLAVHVESVGEEQATIGVAPEVETDTELGSPGTVQPQVGVKRGECYRSHWLHLVRRKYISILSYAIPTLSGNHWSSDIWKGTRIGTWSFLRLAIHTTECLSSFKKQLKAFLFKRGFSLKKKYIWTFLICTIYQLFFYCNIINCYLFLISTILISTIYHRLYYLFTLNCNIINYYVSVLVF